jgi:hypothetical protein
LQRIGDQDERLDGGEQDRAREQCGEPAGDVRMTRDERCREQDRREPGVTRSRWTSRSPGVGLTKTPAL